LGSTYTQVMFMEMLLKSRIQCECENSVIIHVMYGRYMPALTNTKIIFLRLKNCSHLDITSQNYQILV